MSCGEFKLIEKYFSRQATSRDDVLLGIGDDAAVIQLADNEQLVVSTDTLVAGVHFPTETSAYDIGYKLMAVNLSDLAAMGAEPRWASLALTLPDSDDKWLEQFSAGLFALAKKHSVQLIGGDTTRGPLTLTLTLQGTVSSQRFLQRNAAQAGDAIVVSGQLGDAGLALRQLFAKEEINTACLSRLNRPTPRVALGQSLLGIATAAIDISDGLLADLGHILALSQLGAEIRLNDLPLSEAVKAMTIEGDWSLPLSAGDDYELCFTIAESDIERLQKQHCLLTRIGTVVENEGINCITPTGTLLDSQQTGYNHFGSVLKEGS